MVIGLAGMVRVRVRDWELHIPMKVLKKQKYYCEKEKFKKYYLCVCVCRDGVPLKIVK